MLSTSAYSTTQTVETSYVKSHIFVCLLNSGKFVIGQTNNASKSIAELNSGMYPQVPQILQVARVMGVKEQDEERTFAGTVAKFCNEYGSDKVISI